MNILVKYPYVYVANTNGLDGNRVLQLTRDMVLAKDMEWNSSSKH